MGIQVPKHNSEQDFGDRNIAGSNYSLDGSGEESDTSTVKEAILEEKDPNLSSKFSKMDLPGDSSSDKEQDDKEMVKIDRGIVK